MKPPTIQLGDMVALRVAIDPLEPIPFAVGEVIKLENDNLVVWWYGNAHCNVQGSWRPGYYQPADNRRYYSERRLRPDHPRYTSVTSETTLSLTNVIGAPFQLNRRNALPMSVLHEASACPDVEWSLFQEQANLITATLLQNWSL